MGVILILSTGGWELLFFKLYRGRTAPAVGEVKRARCHGVVAMAVAAAKNYSKGT